MSPRDYLHPRSVPAAFVRDLLAICRVLYVTRKNEGADPGELETIKQAGEAFATALKMAHCKPETIGARAAWSWSEKGLKLLGEALSNGDVSVQKLVASWAGKLVQFPER